MQIVVCFTASFNTVSSGLNHSLTVQGVGGVNSFLHLSLTTLGTKPGQILLPCYHNFLRTQLTISSMTKWLKCWIVGLEIAGYTYAQAHQLVTSVA